MEQSKNITSAPATGPGAAAQQANVAAQNAQVVVGDFFGPVFREYYDAQSDFINASLGRWQEYATRVRDINQVGGRLCPRRHVMTRSSGSDLRTWRRHERRTAGTWRQAYRSATIRNALQGIATQAQLPAT